MSVRNESTPNGYPIPVGTIFPFVGTNRAYIPPGWLICNADDLLISDYPELYEVLGTNYNGNTTPAGSFRVPDLVNHQYIVGRAATNPAILPGALAQIDVPVLTANLPTLSSGRFNVTNVGVNANPPPLYGTGGGASGDAGAADELVVATDDRYPDIDINHKAGSYVSFTNNLREDAVATLTAGTTLLEGWLMLYIIKAYNFPVIPPGAPVAPQVPNPTRVYFDCPELSGYIIQ
jgi:microcystin-dependent protein